MEQPNTNDQQLLNDLHRTIGHDNFQQLSNPNNKDKVRDFCNKLLMASFPKMLTVAGRNYDIVCPIRKKEIYLDINTLLARAKKMRAHLGEDDVKHILKYQAELPKEIRRHVGFLFTDLKHPSGDGRLIAIVHWEDDLDNRDESHWIQEWFGPDILRDLWDYVRLLHRRRR